MRRRLDRELVRRGLLPSREQAQVAIESGLVLVAGAPASKAARLVASSDPIVVLGPRPRFVSRGGMKLDAALDQFAIAVDGRSALDAGASTGGFTDCLLQRGATTVLAVDVGRNQLHEHLRSDPRVDSRERTDIRRLTTDAAPAGPFPLIVADLSFISLRSVSDALIDLATPGADLVLLVKPQFEAGRVDVARGRGVISEPEIWRRVLDEVIGHFVGRGAAIMGVMASPLRGADGNVEFLIHALAPGGGHESTVGPGDLDAVVAAVVDDNDTRGGIARPGSLDEQ